MSNVDGLFLFLHLAVIAIYGKWACSGILEVCDLIDLGEYKQAGITLVLPVIYLLVCAISAWHLGVISK